MPPSEAGHCNRRARGHWVILLNWKADAAVLLPGQPLPNDGTCGCCMLCARRGKRDVTGSRDEHPQALAVIKCTILAKQ